VKQESDKREVSADKVSRFIPIIKSGRSAKVANKKQIDMQKWIDEIKESTKPGSIVPMTPPSATKKESRVDEVNKTIYRFNQLRLKQLEKDEVDAKLNATTYLEGYANEQKKKLQNNFYPI
jgi:hypothetical protein